MTPEPAAPRADRWADGEVSPDGRSMLCVREHHPIGGGPADVVNEVVRFDLGAGSGRLRRAPWPAVVVHGPDFVSDPRWRPDGEAICWLEWDHPDMPWDGTRLMVASPTAAASGARRRRPGRVGVPAPAGTRTARLWFVSDRSGWWNLYRWTPSGGVEPMVVLEA